MRVLGWPRDGFVSSMGCLTAFTGDITIAFVEDGALFGPRQFDMGNVGSILAFQTEMLAEGFSREERCQALSTLKRMAANAARALKGQK